MGDDDAGAKSEAEDDGLETRLAMLLSVAQGDKRHSLSVSVFRAHPRRVIRSQQVTGFHIVAVKISKGGVAALRKAIDTALEPMVGEHEFTSYSPTMAISCSSFYTPDGSGFLVEFTTVVVAALLYGTVGAVEMVPVGARTVFVSPPKPTPVAGGGGSDGGEVPKAITMEEVVAVLTEANRVAVETGVAPPFRAVYRDHASKVHWLVPKAKYVAPVPAGGEYIYLRGWEDFANSKLLTKFMNEVGAVQGSTATWVSRGGSGTSLGGSLSTTRERRTSSRR
jgi:hypothetical protein